MLENSKRSDGDWWYASHVLKQYVIHHASFPSKVGTNLMALVLVHNSGDPSLYSGKDLHMSSFTQQHSEFGRNILWYTSILIRSNLELISLKLNR